MAFIGDLTNTLSQAAGVMTPLGAIAGGVSALGSLFGSSPEDKAMALAEKQHLWDVEENQKNRDFQSAEWTRQFNAINAYNDPSATKERINKAGLNASAMLNGSGSAIGQSSGSPSAPSGAFGLNPMPDVVSQVGFQSRESLMKRLEMLGKLGEASYLMPETKQKLSAEVQDILNDAKYKDIKAQTEEYMLSLEKIFGPAMKSVAVVKALKDLAVADAEIRLKGSQATEADANAAKAAEDKLKSIAERELTGKQKELVDLEIHWFGKTRQQEINESKSREASNYGSANLSNAQAKTENELRESKKLALDLSNELSGLDVDFNFETYQKRLEKFSNEVGIVKWTALMSQMEQMDRSAYNAMQRLMLGKGSRKDGLEVIKFMRNYSTDKFDLSK